MIYLGWPDDHYNFNQPNGFRHPHLIRGAGGCFYTFKSCGLQFFYFVLNLFHVC